LLSFETIISCIIQNFLVIQKNTSFGFNVISLVITSISQHLLVVNNIFCQTADFIGILQYPISTTGSQLLSFLVVFVLFLFYLPIIVLNVIFFDKKPLHNRDENDIKIHRRLQIILTIPCITFGIVGGIVWLSFVL
jgi:hypothetical protein